jgi:hypothetical protein
MPGTLTSSAPPAGALRGSAHRGPGTFGPIIAVPRGVLDPGGLADSGFLATIGDTK